MDVKSFILEATEKSLNIDFALKRVETAKEAIEAAKALLDEAKEEVSTAKQSLEEYVDKAEEFNLTKAKFKDAVERMKGVLTDVGALEAPEFNDSGEPKRKTRRTRKSKDKTTAETETQVDEKTSTSEAGTAPDSDNQHTTVVEANSETNTETASTATIVEKVAEVVAPSENTPEEISSEVVNDGTESDGVIVHAEDSELDNSNIVDEIEELINDNVEDPTAQTVLKACLHIADWYSKSVTNTPMSVLPSPLTIEAVTAVEDAGYLKQETQEHYTTAMEIGGERLAALLIWFAEIIEMLADAKTDFNQFSFADVNVGSVVDDDESNEPMSEDEMNEIIEASSVAEASETIEEIALFSEEDGNEVDESVSDEPEKPSPAPAPVTPSKPAWLKR